MNQKAVFVTRDHTLMVADGAICTPRQVQVAAGASDTVRRLREGGYLVVALTNEPGVARGWFDEEALELVHGRLKQALQAEGGTLDGIYYCPYLESAEAVVPQYHRHSELRMPRPGMLHQAAGDHSVDLTASWLVGRTADDIAAGQAAGCRTILLVEPSGSSNALPAQDADYVLGTFEEAAELILSSPPVRRPTRVSEAPPEPEPENERHAAPTPGVEPAGEIVDRLDAVLDLLRQQRRATMHSDFSTVKLLGAACQMVALGLLLWSWIAMMDNQLDAAISRGLSTIAVQLIALTLFVLHRRD